MDLWVNKFKEKVQNQIKSLKNSKQIYNTSPVLQDEEVWKYFKDLQTKFCIAPIDKASNKLSFICKKFYVSKLLDETGLHGTQRDTYKLVNKLKEGVIYDNIILPIKFDLEVQMILMYWIPKMHKTPTGERFIVACRKCSKKVLYQMQLQKLLN